VAPIDQNKNKLLFHNNYRTRAKVIWQKAISLGSHRSYRYRLSSYSCYVMAAILGLIKPEIAPFDPPIMKTLPQAITKHGSGSDHGISVAGRPLSRLAVNFTARLSIFAAA